MRVERFEHTADGAFDDFVFVDAVDIVFHYRTFRTHELLARRDCRPGTLVFLRHFLLLGCRFRLLRLCEYRHRHECGNS